GKGPGQETPDKSMHLLGLLCCRGYTGTNSPDRLIGNHHMHHLIRLQVEEILAELISDKIPLRSCLPDRERLTAAEDDSQAGSQYRIDFLPDDFIGFME